MNRSGLIALQVVGGLSILPYPFVLLANIMSIAAPGRTAASSLIWIALSFYPFVWAALYIFSWRAMKRGSVGLAFGLSSIPAAATVLAVGFLALSWVGFFLGNKGIGPGGLHARTFPTNNPVLDSILLANQDIQIGHEPSRAVDRALRDLDANRQLANVGIQPYGTPLNLALRDLSVSLDGGVNGQQQDRIKLVRGLASRGAMLTPREATDLRKSWLLRRALYDGPVRTSEENPLVWRIVTHTGGSPFSIRPNELPLLNRATTLHGTPLYAALLDNRPDICHAIINAGGRLSASEQSDPAAAAALQSLN